MGEGEERLHALAFERREEEEGGGEVAEDVAADLAAQLQRLRLVEQPLRLADLFIQPAVAAPRQRIGPPLLAGRVLLAEVWTFWSKATPAAAEARVAARRR
jgi:hypothetical protein